MTSCTIDCIASCKLNFVIEILRLQRMCTIWSNVLPPVESVTIDRLRSNSFAPSLSALPLLSTVLYNALKVPLQRQPDQAQRSEQVKLHEAQQRTAPRCHTDAKDAQHPALQPHDGKERTLQHIWWVAGPSLSMLIRYRTY